VIVVVLALATITMLAAITSRQKPIVPIVFGSGLLGAGIGLLVYQGVKKDD
jgi:NO-binding membrane sensor protein with MHYT domain